MKKLLATLIPCIIVCLLLSSCNSNVSIVKRHYRGGYYVDRTKKATAPTPVVNEVAKTTPVKRVYIASISSPQNTIKEIPNEDASTIPNTIIAAPENVQHKNSNSFTENLVKKPVAVGAPTMQKEETSSEGIAGYGGGGGERAALSLLWIIVIIVLILLLIGLLAGGLGDLIYLLLVVALVLLILLLLHII